MGPFLELQPRDPMQPTSDQVVQESSEINASEEARGGPDRRSRPTPAFSRFTLRGRRVANRRDTDSLQNYYVDRAHGPWFWALTALVVMILLDGALTLHILSKGGLEVNPIMDWLYGKGTDWFMGVKVATAAIAFPFLTVHRHFKSAFIGASVLVLAYGGVMLVHAYTLYQIYG